MSVDWRGLTSPWCAPGGSAVALCIPCVLPIVQQGFIVLKQKDMPWRSGESGTTESISTSFRVECLHRAGSYGQGYLLISKLDDFRWTPFHSSHRLPATSHWYAISINAVLALGTFLNAGKTALHVSPSRFCLPWYKFGLNRLHKSQITAINPQPIGRRHTFHEIGSPFMCHVMWSVIPWKRSSSHAARRRSWFVHHLIEWLKIHRIPGKRDVFQETKTKQSGVAREN